MKKTILFGSAVLLFLTACETTRFVPYSDDVYATPVKDKKMAQLALEAKAKKDAEGTLLLWPVSMVDSRRRIA